MKLTWSVTQRKSGRPFTADEIERYELMMKAEGAPDFTALPAPSPIDTEYTIDVVDPGTYSFRLICFPRVGNISDPAEASATIADLSAPVIADFTATT